MIDFTKTPRYNDALGGQSNQQSDIPGGGYGGYGMGPGGGAPNIGPDITPHIVPGGPNPYGVVPQTDINPQGSWAPPSGVPGIPSLGGPAPGNPPLSGPSMGPGGGPPNIGPGGQNPYGMGPGRDDRFPDVNPPPFRDQGVYDRGFQRPDIYGMPQFPPQMPFMDMLRPPIGYGQPGMNPYRQPDVNPYGQPGWKPYGQPDMNPYRQSPDMLNPFFNQFGPMPRGY